MTKQQLFLLLDKPGQLGGVHSQTSSITPTHIKPTNRNISKVILKNQPHQLNFKARQVELYHHCLPLVFWFLGILSRVVVIASQLTIVVKNPPANAGDVRDLGLIPGSERSFGGGHGNLLQYSCLEKSHGQRSLVGYTVHGVTKSWT